MAEGFQTTMTKAEGIQLDTKISQDNITSYKNQIDQQNQLLTYFRAPAPAPTPSFLTADQLAAQNEGTVNAKLTELNELITEEENNLKQYEVKYADITGNSVENILRKRSMEKKIAGYQTDIMNMKLGLQNGTLTGKEREEAIVNIPEIERRIESMKSEMAKL
jgi:hypothetical protein